MTVYSLLSNLFKLIELIINILESSGFNGLIRPLLFIGILVLDKVLLLSNNSISDKIESILVEFMIGYWIGLPDLVVIGRFIVFIYYFYNKK